MEFTMTISEVIKELEEYVKGSLKEYFKKDYFFIYFSQQSSCYDPMKTVIDTVFDCMNYAFVDEIENNDIVWIYNS